MSDVPVLVQYQQGNDVSPPPEGFKTVTSPLNPLRSAASRLAHFDEDVYDLSAESHIVRLLKALLGDAGVGLLSKQMVLVRLQQTLSGTHFFDLDAFYGALFGAGRRVDEILPHDPYAEALPIETWDEISVRDGAYRSRASQLSQAIHLGATARGIRKFAEAMTGVEFDLTEDWQYGSWMIHTWDDWQGVSYDTLDGYTWDEMERSPFATEDVLRNVATLHPSRPLSVGERYDLEQAIDRVKPANMIVFVSEEIPDVEIKDLDFSAESPSEKWEIRQLVQNSRINGILPYPDYPEDEFISPPVSPWSGYSGEAWTVLDRTPRALAFITQGAPSTTDVVDPSAVEMAPQALSGVTGGTPSVSLPEHALKQVQGLYSGRSASDGIVNSNPYGERRGQGTRLMIDGLDASIAKEGLSTSARTIDLFWTSPSRGYDDPTNEVLELRFDEPVNFNYFSFQMAKFPCTVTAQYWDRSDGQWIDMASVSYRESNPYSFPNQPPDGAPHPMHWGDNHWEKRSFTVTPVLTSIIRFVFQRLDGIGPYGNTNSEKIAYPVGLREIDVGYRVTSVSKVPHVSSGSPVASNKNIAGLQTRYFVNVAKADLVEDDELTAWVCEPQPFSDAVVSMYLSIGDGRFPEVVNNLYLDPVHTGATMNLYSTLDIPVGDENSEPKDDVLYPSVNGSVSPVLSGNQGLNFPASDPAWVDVDTRPIGGTSTGGTFWLGVSWEFRDFPVAPAQGRFVPIVSTTLPQGHINVTHGLEEGTDDYTIYVTLNGSVFKMTWPNYLPAESQTARVVVSAGGTSPGVLGQIDSGSETAGTLITGNDSLAVDGTYSPNRNRRPADWYEEKADALSLSLNAADYAGGTEWVGTYSADVEDVEFFGNPNLVNDETFYFPGDENNYLNVPVNTAQTDLATSELIYGQVRMQPTIWNTGTERFFGGSLGSNVNAGGGFGWGLFENGRLMFEWDTGGTTYQAIADADIPRDGTLPVDVAFTLDTDTVRFWFKDIDSSIWTQVGNDIDTDLISGGPTTIGNPSRAFKIGASAPAGGTRGARPFHGAISHFILAEGIATLGTSPSDYIGNLVIAFAPSDYGALTPNSEKTSFTSATGDTVAIVSDDAAETIFPLSILSGPGFVVEDFTSTGIDIADQVADVGFEHWLAATITASIPFAPAAGYSPILTKKLSSSSTDRGWGLYLKSNGNFVVLASDGTSQVEVEWTNASGVGSSMPPCNFALHGLTNAIRLASYQIGETPAADYVEGDWSGLVELSNSERVRILSDGTDVTPGVVYAVNAGSGERETNVLDFHLVAQSLAQTGSYTSIGSSWLVTESGTLPDGRDVIQGDVLFEQTDGIVHPNGNVEGDASYLAIQESAEIRYGSTFNRGSGIKLLGSTAGYGSGPGASYLSAPDDYNKIPLSSDTSKVLGTFMRYHPDYFGWTEGLNQSIGFMGGTPEAWGQAVWTPIGQFVLAKGSFNFRDTLAKAIKMEFTQLSPEPYESFLPINRMVSRMTKLTDEELGRSMTISEQAAIDVLTPNRFSETIARYYRPNDDPLLNNVSPTAGSVVIDGAMRDAIARDFGPMYGMTEWQQSFRSPIQDAAGIHTYNVTPVQVVSRTAFFVGLRTARVRRIGQRGRKDNPYYWETFYDTDNVDVALTNFEIEPGQLYTPEFRTSSLMPVARTAQSRPFYARSPIVAVQFATQQSQSVQVIPDDEFRSNELKSSAFSQADKWHRSGDAIAFWDSAFGSVRVSRDPGVLDAFYSPDTPIVHPPVSPVLASGFGRIVQYTDDSQGGIASPSVSVAPRGVIWCAARVAAYNELRGDLYLRAYDTTGTLLAEKAFRPKTGFPSEVQMSFVSYRAEPYGIEVRVEQDGPYHDSWIMYALSAFDSGVLWEFSNDGGETWVPGYTARNLVNGVVEFPTPGAALLWKCKAYRYNVIIDAIEMRPWYERRIGASLA